MEILFSGHALELLEERAIWWQAESTLFISDLHLGKTQHFRKNGIALSSGAELKDEAHLYALLTKYPAKKLFILGDLFHSELNTEWPLLAKIIQDFHEVEMTLVLGNHDIIDCENYHKIGMQTIVEQLDLGPFILIHDPEHITEEKKYHLCGHLHPGVLIKGKARQSLKLPAFYLYKNTLYLPAFGSLTGLYIPAFSKKAKAFAIVSGGVHAIDKA